MNIVDWFIGLGIWGWIGSVFLVNVLINISSNYLQRLLDLYRTELPDRLRLARLSRETRKLHTLRRLHQDEVYRDAFLARQLMAGVLLGVLLLAGFIAPYLSAITPDPEMKSLAERFFNMDKTMVDRVGYYLGYLITGLVTALVSIHFRNFSTITRDLEDVAKFEANFLKNVGEFPPDYVPIAERQHDRP